MKKIFSFVICVLLTSCYTDGTDKVNNATGIGGEIYVKEFFYKNHSYLEIKDKSLYGHGFVHNPECMIKDIDSLMTRK